MLDERLRCVAALVRPGRRVADIGTDHAFLPVTLVTEGRCPHAIASDVRPGPVANARRTVTEAGCTDTVEVRLGDGLATVAPDEAEDIVIAGMGGETMAAILEAAPWVRCASLHLVLQPMTRAEQLRQYLWDNGFSIEEERAVSVGRRHYTVLSVYYTGIPFVYEEALAYVGRLPRTAGAAYLKTVERHLSERCKGDPTPATAYCLERVRAYRLGTWKPWEE